MGSNSTSTAFDPILDVTAGMTDDEMTERFRRAIELANLEKKVKGVPIAGYDAKLKKAFLEYPDGSRQYAE